MTNAAPYPADVKTKGWIFEMDIDQIQQSDTWALASPDVRPWLLMIWVTAWSLTPSGSLPGDETVLCARIGIPRKLFDKNKDILMRGWTMASDGRLYHDTITSLVLQMLDRRKSEAERKSEYRKKKEAERLSQSTTNSPQMSHGTNTGQTCDSTRNPTLTTDHIPIISKEVTHTHSSSQGCEPDFEKPTSGALAAMAMKRGGIGAVSPQHPKLLAMVSAGVTPEQFEQAAVEAVKKSKGFAYALGILEGQLREANALTADGLAMPAKPWNESRSTIEAEAERLGIGRWDEAMWSIGKGQSFAEYTKRVEAARNLESEVS